MASYFQVISRQSCTPKADVWAIGVITYILLAGYPPFFVEESLSGSENESILLKKIINGEYEFLEETWKDTSPEAIDFIRLLMTSDPQKRPTCEEALGCEISYVFLSLIPNRFSFPDTSG